MGLEEFKILFDNELGIFFSGQTVSGKVFIHLSSTKKINTLYLTFKGEAYASWHETETRHHNNERHSTQYTGQELYFNNTIYLVTSNIKENVLPVGDVTYPFSYALPVKLPSSFEGSYGYVRYTVRATLDRPWKFNQDAKSVFTVISHTDLNLLPQLRSPLTQTKTKSVCCLCCNTGPITMVARIPFTGFVSGQDIPLTIDMENPTRININNVNCVMMQVATFQSQQPYASFRYERRPVAKLDLGPVEHNSSKLLDGTMKIPPSPPSLLPNCNIIKLQYIIEVKATVAGPHKNMYVNLPITVGTVPLIFQDNWEPSPSAPLLEPTAPAYPELPPPSYDECYFGSSNIKEQGDTQYTFGSTQYVPRYPTYNM